MINLSWGHYHFFKISFSKLFSNLISFKYDWFFFTADIRGVSIEGSNSCKAGEGSWVVWGFFPTNTLNIPFVLLVATRFAIFYGSGSWNLVIDCKLHSVEIHTFMQIMCISSCFLLQSYIAEAILQSQVKNFSSCDFHSLVVSYESVGSPLLIFWLSKFFGERKVLGESTLEKESTWQF